MNNRKKVDGGFFITLEGVEGAGKSTQAKMLADRLISNGYDLLATREPGGTQVGDKLRYVVQHICGEEAACTEAELLIFCASRAQLMRKVILPHLHGGGIVICDRFADSTTAYQGYGRGIDFDFISHLHRFTFFGHWPNMTILLDLDATQGLQRSKKRVETLDVRDRIENESQKFHEKVRDGFLRIAQQEMNRIKVIKAQKDQKSIHKQIMEYVDYGLGRVSRSVPKNRGTIISDTT